MSLARFIAIMVLLILIALLMFACGPKPSIHSVASGAPAGPSAPGAA